MNAAPVLKYVTVEEYLKAEEDSLEKNEFYQGEIFAMPGASFIHNQIVSNVHIDIGQFLRDKDCRIFPADLKIHVEANGLFTYPDLSIICGKPLFWNNRTDTVLNPSVLIEVLSKRTMNYDRGGKFALYRDIPSLQEYVLISSTEMRLEKFNKQSPNEWKFTEYKAGEDEIRIDTINYTALLHTFYRDVDFSLAGEEIS